MINTILRAARKRLGKSQGEIADLVGVSRPSINQIEIGRRGIPKNRFNAVVSAYQLTKQEKEEILAMIEEKWHLNIHLAQLPFSPEVTALNYLLALSPEKRKWVIKAAIDFEVPANQKK